MAQSGTSSSVTDVPPAPQQPNVVGVSGGESNSSAQGPQPSGLSEADVINMLKRAVNGNGGLAEYLKDNLDQIELLKKAYPKENWNDLIKEAKESNAGEPDNDEWDDD